MVIGTSALLAILRDEPERRTFTEAIEAAETRSMSAATFVETSIVIESRYGAAGLRDLDALIAFTLPLFPYETRSESRRVC
jgi:ribonuclease VapC